ncbi:MAG: hypothetical protein OES46_10540 [Gammaproteobacteria bacterium]|nr:hypothetical protein [Gammaproteobacteria bacterium]
MEQVLPKKALPVWRIYRAMEESKRKHFSYLEQLETKYKHGGSRTVAESIYLEGLLKQHGKQVTKFREAIKQLQRDDDEAHQALIEHITMLNAQHNDPSY